MTREGWNAGYPDPENFHQTLSGGNAIPGGENYSRFKLAEFDDRYEKSGNFPTAKRATASTAKWKTS